MNRHRLDHYTYLIFDGTFLHRPTSIVALMDSETMSIIAGEYDIRENSEPQLFSFFEPLKVRGLSPKSCTVDGNPQVIKTLRKIWPNMIIQRCLVHIQRQGLSWCRRKPKRTDAKKLRELFLKVSKIQNKQEQKQFLKQLFTWEKKYGTKIENQPEKGKVFSDLKRARSMIMKALPNMFHYLDDPHIPKTTNGIEGYFSRLKRHYQQHRGMNENKRKNYFNWYFYLKPK